MSLTRKAILAAPDLETVEVETPEWGGAVRVRALDGRGAAAWAEAARAADGLDGLAAIAALVQLSIVDANGVLLFEAADREALAGKNPNALRRLFDAALALNGFGAAAAEQAEKN